MARAAISRGPLFDRARGRSFGGDSLGRGVAHRGARALQLVLGLGHGALAGGAGGVGLEARGLGLGQPSVRIAHRLVGRRARLHRVARRAGRGLLLGRCQAHRVIGGGAIGGGVIGGGVIGGGAIAGAV